MSLSGLTHEGSNVAYQAEQAAFRRVRTTFTAGDGDKTTISMFFLHIFSVTMMPDVWTTLPESRILNQLVLFISKSKTEIYMMNNSIKKSLSLMMPFNKSAFVLPSG